MTKLDIALLDAAERLERAVTTLTDKMYRATPAQKEVARKCLQKLIAACAPIMGEAERVQCD
jgi:hypothetical protein